MDMFWLLRVTDCHYTIILLVALIGKHDWNGYGITPDLSFLIMNEL